MGGIGDFAVEETNGYDWDYEKTDDQGNQKISNEPSLDGGDYHGATFLFKESFVPDYGENLSPSPRLVFQRIP